MRRMITEKDVEKLDSIQPSEIQKLGKITNADIESVQATQSPKDATAGYVLTAVSGGTAVYKPQSAAGSRIVTNTKSFQDITIKTSNEYGTYLEIQVPCSNLIASYFRWGLKMDANTYIDLGMVCISPYSNPLGGWDYVHIYISPEAITKYSITAENKFSGNIRYVYFKD